MKYYTVKIPMEGYNNYIISTNGEVFRVTDTGKLKELSQSLSAVGQYKVNLYNSVTKKQTTIETRLLVYRSFINESYRDSLVHLDGNTSNNSIDNIATLEEVMTAYRKCSEKFPNLCKIERKIKL